MAKQKGIDFVLSADDTGGSPAVIGGASNGDLTINDALIDVTDKDGSGWEEILDGLRSWSVSSEHFVDETDAAFDTVEDAMIAGTELDISIATGGSTVLTGSCYVESFRRGGAVGGAETASISLKGNGALAKA